MGLRRPCFLEVVIASATLISSRAQNTSLPDGVDESLLQYYYRINKRTDPNRPDRFQFQDISSRGVGLEAVSETDDKGLDVIEVPFEFLFYGHVEKKFYVNPNGFASTFEKLPSPCRRETFCNWESAVKDTALYMRFIAPFMSDFNPGYSNESNVFYLIELSPSDAALIPQPPTPNSTSSNSSFPTASPSSSPSLSPSLPTERPTIAPSVADSNSTNATNATGGVESVAPTQSPSASSSQAPSQAPSPSPSVSPASWPGVAPNLVEESRLIIQWDKVLLYEPSQYSSGSPTDVSQRPFTFQAVIYANGDMVFNYKDVPFNPLEKILAGAQRVMTYPLAIGTEDAAVSTALSSASRYGRVKCPSSWAAAGASIEFVAQPRCNSVSTCGECIAFGRNSSESKSLTCGFCGNPPLCIDGISRGRYALGGLPNQCVVANGLARNEKACRYINVSSCVNETSQTGFKWPLTRPGRQVTLNCAAGEQGLQVRNCSTQGTWLPETNTCERRIMLNSFTPVTVASLVAILTAGVAIVWCFLRKFRKDRDYRAYRLAQMESEKFSREELVRQQAEAAADSVEPPASRSSASEAGAAGTDTRTGLMLGATSSRDIALEPRLLASSAERIQQVDEEKQEAKPSGAEAEPNQQAVDAAPAAPAACAADLLTVGGAGLVSDESSSDSDQSGEGVEF